MEKLKNVLLFPLKVLWFILAWPCILGWKVFKFLLKNPVFKTEVGGKDTGGGALISLGLGVVLLIAIPLTTWMGIIFGIQHFCGNHNPKMNFVCGWLDEKTNQETPSEGASVPSVSPKETSTPNADTNSVVESENPVTE